MRRDLQMGSAEPVIEVIASADIRNSAAVPIPDETAEERKRRDEVFFAVLEAGGSIGRASWRERVCQYVLIPVVAVLLKKKTYRNYNNKSIKNIREHDCKIQIKY